MEHELRRMFEIKGAEMSVPSTLSPGLRNGVRKQRMIMGGLVAAAAVAVVIAGFAGARSLSNDAAPLRPAEESEKAAEAMSNGPILHSDANGMFWLGGIAPPPPTEDPTYHWHAFDQDSGSFLYARSGKERVWIVDEDGLVAEVDCPASSSCGDMEMATFGPASDEITLPSADASSVHVLGLDGTLHGTLDISGATTSGQDLVDLAWSPDGSRLALSTEFDLTKKCRAGNEPCGRVWILDGEVGEPHAVYTEGADERSALRDLAWSPDGDTVALVSGPMGGICTGREPWPRLVALHVAQEQAVSAETLHVYDDGALNSCILAKHYSLSFPFAWSPDGTRIAVTQGGGIAEISTEDGEVLERDFGEAAEGPLAWLPKS